MGGCSFEEHARAIMDPSNFFCLGREESIGLTVVVEAGLLSISAILFVVLIIARNVRWRLRHLPNRRLQIFHQPLDILMASLFFADVVQAIGSILSLKWIHSGKVEVGTFCTAQGIIKIFGSTGVALSTLAIAVYTFLGVWVMRGITSMKYTLVVVAAIWSFVALLVTVAMTVHRDQKNFMGPTPYWCWLNTYTVGYGWQLGVEYLWMWITLGMSILVYVPLYLWMRGNLVIDESAWWRFPFQRSPVVDQGAKERRRKSLVMLAYPAVYCLCILPLSAVRWKSFTQTYSAVTPTATLTVAFIFGLSGFLNVILLLKTRPSSGLFGQLMLITPARPPSIHEQHGDIEIPEMRPEVPLRNER